MNWRMLTSLSLATMSYLAQTAQGKNVLRLIWSLLSVLTKLVFDALNELSLAELLSSICSSATHQLHKSACFVLIWLLSRKGRESRE